MSTNLPNLVSFPSWEYDVASAMSSSGYVASAASFDVSVSTAGGGGDASSHVMASISSMSTFTASTAGSTNGPSASVAKAHHDDAVPHSRASSSVEVHVSGCRFTIPAATFAKLRVLPWEKGSRSNTLRTCPKLFEIILNHMLFDTFPDVRSLSVSDVEELEPMALLLELNGLVDHLLAHRHKARLDGSDGKKLFRASKAQSIATGSTVASRIFRSRQDKPPNEPKQGPGDSSRVSRPSHKSLLRASSCPTGGNHGSGSSSHNRKLLWTARAQWRQARQTSRTAACEWDKVVHSVHSETLEDDPTSWMEIHRTLS
jgi:hypothetical protein